MRLLLSAGSALALTLGAPAFAATPAEVVDTYADIAEASYGDSLATARTLQVAVEAFLAAPSQDTLDAARAA